MRLPIHRITQPFQSRVMPRAWSITLGLFLLLAPRHTRAQNPSVGAPLTAFDSAKVHALLQSRLPCLGCHVLDGKGGRIGPDLTQVASRRSAAYIRAMLDDPQRVVPGSAMPRVPMPPAMRALVTDYLTAGAAAGAAVPTTRAPASSPRTNPSTGAALYARNCAACHGERGRGDGPNARYLPTPPAPHADSKLMSERSDDRLFDAIYAGGYPLGRSATMPAFGETLTRAEIRSLVRHLRTLCRCEGPAWARRMSASP